jgi:glycosyltransferase involved in cell wall biosynthesis
MHFHSGFIPRSTTLGRWAQHHSIPYVVTPNGNCSTKLLRRRPTLKVPYWHLFERPFLARAAFLHAVGDQKEIEKLIDGTPIVNALNGIDAELLPRFANPDLILQRYPHWRSRKVFLYIGRLDVRQKGLDLLLRGFSRALRSGLNGSLLLAGPDWQGGRATLEKLGKKLGLEENLSFWGGVYGEDKFNILAGADFFVHPSRWEGMSFSVIEALAYGKVCLVTPEADPGGLIRKYAAGVLTEPTVEFISQGLRDLARAPETDLTVFRQNACVLVRKELGWKGITETILDGYRTFGKID